MTLSVVAAMLNFELPDHPVYDAGELLWFDDLDRGTGMMVFLRRRSDQLVDYYPEPGLRLDPAEYYLGGGVGSWTVTEFAASRLQITHDGVVAEARFTDVDGRLVEVGVDDRDGSPRRRCGLLAPVSDDIERPAALLLAWLPAFDLVRRGRSEPVIRIDGRDVPVVQVPAKRLHRRHIIKYSAPLCAVELAGQHDGPLEQCPQEAVLQRAGEGWEVSGLLAYSDDHHARLACTPALPDLRSLREGEERRGRWHLSIDDARLTGGGWHARRAGDRVRVGLDIEERWRPGRLPALMHVVTRLVPAFKRWPTTYRWRAEVALGPEPSMTSARERVPLGRRRPRRSRKEKAS